MFSCWIVETQTSVLLSPGKLLSPSPYSNFPSWKPWSRILLMGSHPWTLTGPSGRSPSPSRQVGVTPEHSDTSLALLKETRLEQGCALTASRKDKTPAKLQQSSMSCGKYTQKVRLLGNKTETSPASSQPGCPASWLGNFFLIYRSGRAPECREHRDHHGN